MGRRFRTLLLAVTAAGGLAIAPAAHAQTLPELGPLPDMGELTAPACGAAQAAAGVAPPVTPVADAICDLDGPLEFTYVTVYDPPGPAEPVRRTHLGVSNVPSPLDADGDGAPDLTATLNQLSGGGASLLISRTAAAPSPLPVSVEALLVLPQAPDRTAAIGYDALASDAPQDFNGTYNFVGAATAVTLTTLGAGPSLAVIGELFVPGSDGEERTEPIKARVNFAPVPATTAFTLSATGATSTANITTSAPSRVDLLIEDRSGSGATTVDATIADLPNSVTIQIVEVNGTSALRYSASDPIASVTANLVETQGSTLVSKAELALANLPTQVDLDQPSADSVELRANAPVGVIDVAFARGGEPRRLAAPAYAYIFDDGTLDSVVVRALGVQHVRADLADGMSLDATVQSGPFRVLFEEGARRIDGLIADLPSQFSLDYVPSTGSMSYTGSAAIGLLTVDATDPAGVLGRATDVDLRVEGIPTTLSLTFAQGGDNVTLDAGGQQIGLIELQATDGPIASLPESQDGLIVRDSPSQYLLFARIHGLRKATASTAANPDIFLDATGNRVFQVDIEEGGEYTRATLDRLQPNTRVRIEAITGGSRMTYTAAAPTNSLTFETNSGSRDYLTASLVPLPDSVVLCSANGTGCNGSGAANSGSARFTASQHTTVNMFECTKPATGCTPSNATESTRITNLLVRVLGFDANVNSGGVSGRVFIDTDNHALSGQINRRMEGTVDRLDINLPVGFKAQDRTVNWNLVNIFNPIQRSGSITCPGGTAFDVRVLGITVDVDGLIC